MLTLNSLCPCSLVVGIAKNLLDNFEVRFMSANYLGESIYKTSLLGTQSRTFFFFILELWKGRKLPEWRDFIYPCGFYILFFKNKTHISSCLQIRVNLSTNLKANDHTLFICTLYLLPVPDVYTHLADNSSTCTSKETSSQIRMLWFSFPILLLLYPLFRVTRRPNENLDQE